MKSIDTAIIKRPLLLENPVQPYAWGSFSAIQALTGSTETNTPWAELWMGAHPKAPSMVAIGGEWIALDQLVRQHPEVILGTASANRFDGTFPFLFKVLAAAAPLSIQAHPNRRQAASGFDRENKQRVPLDSPGRNYRDPYHKPEIICALNRFTALKGFRPVTEMRDWLQTFCPFGLADEIKMLMSDGENGLRRFFATLLTLPEARKLKIIGEALGHARESGTDTLEGGWINRLYDQYPEDIGILSPALLNLIELEPGQALFLPAGELHAYLDGVGIELMANSDNVLRGGLTPKHIDVEELMDVLNFSPSATRILTPAARSAAERVYPVCAEAFFLSVISVSEDVVFDSSSGRGVEILLCIEGQGQIRYGSGDAPLTLSKGAAALIPAASPPYRITGDAHIYKAAVPNSVKFDERLDDLEMIC